MKTLKLFITIFLWLIPIQLSAKTINYDVNRLPINHNCLDECSQDQILIINNQIVLSNKLQQQLTPEIVKAKEELIALSQRISIDFTENFGMVYIHQGRDNWLIKFTYGGLILNSSDNMIVSIEEIFTLKKAFENTNQIEIEGIKYPTTGFMRQLGPILHDN